MTTKIFVSDDVSEGGLGPLRSAGFIVEKRPGLALPELREALQDCEGLIVRSETRVTSELLDAANGLRVIGRAGVGVDNIDVNAATIRGVVVMNAPDGNTITTAEHTIALLISLARSIPQASSSLKGGSWDRKKFIGVELQGKTLGIVGLGRIGRVVASRARAMGMLIVAYDPFIAPEHARDLEIELAPLDEVYSRADFLNGSYSVNSGNAKFDWSRGARKNEKGRACNQLCARWSGRRAGALRSFVGRLNRRRSVGCFQ